jgi:hypothetical protein
MYELKKIVKFLTSKSVGTGPSSYEKKNLPGRGLTKVEKHWNSSLITTFEGKSDVTDNCRKCGNVELHDL